MVTLYAGMGTGAAYTLFQCVRRLLPAGKAFTIAADLLFLVTAFLIVTAILYEISALSLRFYQFLGIAIGFGIWKAGMEPLIRLLYCKFFRNAVDKMRKKRSNK